MKVAMIHDWLTGMRGGEKCLEAICELFPKADLYTLIYLPEKVFSTIRAMKVKASWINRLPGIEKYYRYCLPLFPSAIERIELQDYDLVLSSSHCVAKGVFPHRALHIAYLHTPMRYIWDMYDVYFKSDAPRLASTGMHLWRKHLQRWDIRSAARVDFFVANSRNIASKIKKFYGREAFVIHPPVDTEAFYILPDQEPYFLIVSALVPYKKIDLAIEAFNKVKIPLKIAGDGPLRKKLEKVAGPNIEFLGWVDGEALSDLYASCQALILPGEEDFGIAPVEAQASGRPVIAYGKGGVLETVIPCNVSDSGGRVSEKPTGIFFDELTPKSLIQAIELYNKTSQLFDPTTLRDYASQFSRDRFKARIKEYIEARLEERRAPS